jgi:hypothetical protein
MRQTGPASKNCMADTGVAMLPMVREHSRPALRLDKHSTVRDDGSSALRRCADMHVTDRFVYIHTSRHGGTFINEMMDKLLGAQMVGYHYQLAKLPPQYRHLPVIGFVRNPWDWYVSVFHDYARKPQHVFDVLSQGKTLGFKDTVKNFLLLGSGSQRARDQLAQIAERSPRKIENPLVRSPALERGDFETYPDMGYYSWLWRRMHGRDGDFAGDIGRFESFRPELLRLLRSTGAALRPEVEQYILTSPPANTVAHRHYRDYYDAELRDLVAAKDAFIIERFGYRY